MHIIKNIPIIFRKPLRVLRRSKRARRKTLAIILSVLSVLISARFVFFSPPEVEAAWYHDSWTYRKKLVIDETKVSGSTDLTDFPVLVKRDDDTDLRDHAQSDGDDILFTDVNGAKLDHEIENYNSSDADLVAWVRIPTLLASEDSVIYMYYGNPSAANQENVDGVWNSDYVGVWHINENSEQHLDSTSYSNDTNSVSVTQQGADVGKVNGADEFDGTDDYATIPDDASLRPTGDITVEAWVKLNNLPSERSSENEYAVAKMLSGAPWQSYVLYVNPIDKASFRWTNNSGTDYYSYYDTTVSTDTWYHLAGVHDGSTLRFYFNGSATGTVTGSPTGTLASANNNLLRFGNEYNHNRRLDGFLDEVRISSTARSADWLATSHETMNSPSSFFKSVGSEEVGPGPEGYWAFDEGYGTVTNDQTSNNNDGTITGADWKTEGLCVSGKCLYYDGSDEYVDVGSVGINDTKGTISAWVKFTDITTQRRTILGWGSTNATDVFVWALRLASDGDGNPSEGNAYIQLRVVENDSSPNNTLRGSTLINAATWYHVAVTADDSSYKIYINGKEETIDIDQGSNDGKWVGSLTQPTGTTKAYFGSQFYQNSYANEIDGFIDELKVYNYARSAEQIRTDYIKISSLHGASSAYGLRDYSYLSDGLVGYWPMDEATNTDRADSSGNGNTLTESTGDDIDGVPGKFNKSGDFEDTDEDYLYITDANQTGLEFDGDYTVNLWVNFEEKDQNNTFISKGVGVSGTYTWVGWFWGDSSYRLSLTHWESGSSETEISSFAASDIAEGTWYMMTVTYDDDSDEVVFCLDGTCDSPDILTKDKGDEGADVLVGQGNSGNYMDGKMDELRVYSRTLTPSEVEGLYRWAPGPVGYWNFDEGTGTSTVYDRSGNGNNGTMNGSMTEDDWVPGKIGSALDFDGSDDTVIANSVMDGDQSTWGGITVTAWVKHESYSPTAQEILRFGNHWFGCDTNLQTDGFAFSINYPAKTAGGGGELIPNLNQWYYVVGTYDKTNVILYVDGIEIDRTANTDAMEDASDFSISRAEDPNRKINGLIDDVRVYNYARTQEQIIEDMNAGHPAPGSPIGSSVLHYKFDEGYGDTTNDSSVQSNDGDLAGSGGSCPGAAACPTWTNSGKFDKSLEFDKTNDYVFVSNGFTNTIKGDDTHTVSAWIYPRTVSGDTTVISLDDGSSYGFYIVLRTGGYYVSYGGSWRTYTSIYSLDEWQHLAVVKNGTGDNMTLYLNGVEQSSYTGSVSSIPNLDDDFLIGKSPGGYIFDGYIDEVKIYNFSLTAEQIKLDYNKGSTASFGNIADQNDEGFGGDPPVGWWKMDENTDNTCDATNDVCDTSGNNYHGAKTNMDEADWVPGKIGSALDFDGSNDRVTMGDVLDLTGSSGITLSAWIYARTINSWDSIIDKLGGSGNYRFMLMSNGRVELGIRDTASGYEALTTDNGTINTGQWYHVAATFDDNTTGKIYINGVLNKTKTDFTLTRGNTGEPLGLGYASNNGQYFDGLIDDARIYNYVRSPAQIAYDYNRGGPVGYWKLDECQGTTAYDSGSGGNNGTITIGATGSNTTPGTCSSGTGTEAWNNGTNGKRNYSLSFDGTNDYIDLGTPTNLGLTGDAAFSLALWAKPTATRHDGSFVSYGNAGTNQVISINSNSSGAIYSVHYSNDHSFSTAWQLGEWQHVVLTYDPSTSTEKLYVNGQYKEQWTPSNLSLVSGHKLFIGRATWNNTYVNTTLIDDVHIYTYALTDDQIKKVYNNGAVYFGPLEGSP